MEKTDKKQNDVELTPEGVNFMNIGDVIGGFFNSYSTRIFDCTDDENGRVIPVMGMWDTTPRYGCFVINRAEERLYLRAMNPTEKVSQEERIKHRDNFADGFIDYLVEEGIDIK